MAKTYTIKLTNIVLLLIGIAYIYLAFAFLDTKEECKECEEKKRVPVELHGEKHARQETSEEEEYFSQ